MTMYDLFQFRHLFLTSVHTVFAAILEGASYRYIQRAWSFTFDTFDLFGRIHMNGELCPYQCFGIWMYCMVRNILSGNGFYNVSQIHNCDLMRKRTDKPYDKPLWHSSLLNIHLRRFSVFQSFGLTCFLSKYSPASTIVTADRRHTERRQVNTYIQ